MSFFLLTFLFSLVEKRVESTSSSFKAVSSSSSFGGAGKKEKEVKMGHNHEKKPRFKQFFCHIQKKSLCRPSSKNSGTPKPSQFKKYSRLCFIQPYLMQPVACYNHFYKSCFKFNYTNNAG